MIDPVIIWFVALGGALLFGSAAVHKLRGPGEFLATLGEYRVMPAVLVRPAAVLVVVLECALTLGLLWSDTRVPAAVAGATLLAVYTSAIGVNLARGRRGIDCGCAMQPRPIGGWMIVRNALLGAALLVVAVPASSRPLGWPDIATLGAALLVATLLYASADLLLGRAVSRHDYSMESP